MMKSNKQKDELDEKLEFIKSIIQYINDFGEVTYVGTDRDLFNACQGLFNNGYNKAISDFAEKIKEKYYSGLNKKQLFEIIDKILKEIQEKGRDD